MPSRLQVHEIFLNKLDKWFMFNLERKEMILIIKVKITKKIETAES